MSNFEHRITEDSTEFEKAFLKIYDGNLWTALEKMKDWQPPKQLVEVPQIVADWFENNEDDLSFKIWGYLINWKLQDKKSDFFKWMKKESECIETLIRMQDGYTVKKEQLYYLCEKNTGYYLNKKGDSLKLVVNPYFDDDNKFTQSEIDKLNIGSYEQISVKVDEVKP